MASLHCAICNAESTDLYPEPAKEHGFECTCGYIIPVPPDELEVPESFAKAQHVRAGIEWVVS